MTHVKLLLHLSEANALIHGYLAYMSFIWFISKKCWTRNDSYRTQSVMESNQIMTNAVPLPRHAAEQDFDWPMMWNVMIITWCQSDKNASKRAFGTCITNDYVFNGRVWMFSLLSTRTRCWTSSQIVGDLKHHDAHVCHCNNMAANAISALLTITSPMRDIRCFLCCQPGHAVEENSGMWPIIWNGMALIWRHCSNNATKWYFGITNDYFFN